MGLGQNLFPRQMLPQHILSEIRLILTLLLVVVSSKIGAESTHKPTLFLLANPSAGWSSEKQILRTSVKANK